MWPAQLHETDTRLNSISVLIGSCATSVPSPGAGWGRQPLVGCPPPPFIDSAHGSQWGEPSGPRIGSIVASNLRSGDGEG